MSELQIAGAVPLAIAALIGLAVGLERQWSGHASGPDARFAGLRTFLMLGLLGGLAGMAARENYEILAAVIAGAGMFLSIAAYVMFVRNPAASRDGTTETAAIIVVALGAIATAISPMMAAASGSVVVLALNEKKRLHGAVGRLHPEELRGALQFAVLALVIWPLLPEGPFLGWVAIRPRTLWMIVLVFCAINFIGFLARRSVGEGRRYIVTGLLGGVISSTAVTFAFGRYSRDNKGAEAALAAGVIGACTVLIPRVLIISSVIRPDVAVALLPYILPAGLIGAAVVWLVWKYGPRWEDATQAPPVVSWMAPSEKHPLRFWVALQLAVIFQVAIVIITFAQRVWALKGIYGTSVLLGLTDVDALTVSMSSESAGIIPAVAARAIAIGILSNTLVKLGVSIVVGSARYRLIAGGVLVIMAAAIGIAML